MRSRLYLLMSVVLLMSLSAPAIAATPKDPMDLAELKELRTYFHCGDDTKVANASNILSGTTVSWDENRPTTSYTAGGGCGHGDTNLTGTTDHNGWYDAPFTGTYDGAIDSITFTIDTIDIGFPRISETVPFRLHLQIDGRDVVARDNTVIYEFPGQRSASGLSTRIEFTVTDIGLKYVKDDVPHTVDATLYSHYLDAHNAWVFDATEIDGGLTFNKPKPAFDKIKAIKQN